MIKKINVVELRAQLGKVLDEILYYDHVYQITRRRKVVATLSKDLIEEMNELKGLINTIK